MSELQQLGTMLVVAIPLSFVTTLISVWFLSLLSERGKTILLGLVIILPIVSGIILLKVG